MIENTCQHCGKVFIRNRRRFYCSRECALAHKRKPAQRITRTCPVCGKDFETTPWQPKVRCSRKCYFVTRRKAK